MKKSAGRWFHAVAIQIVAALALPDRAHAAFITYICDDASWTGGGDTIVVDQGPGDNFPGSALVGRINSGALSIGGFTIVTNVAQRNKTATNSMLDLTLMAVTNNNAPHTIYL